MSNSDTARSQRRTLAATAEGGDRWLGLLLVTAAGLLLLGWMLPIMTVEKLLILSERVSILRACAELWSEKHYFLFLVIGVFSVVFPLIKLCVALGLWHCADLANPSLQRWLGWLEVIGRWSMLDVFAVGIGVAATQISLISEVTLHAGIYLFTAAVVLSIAVVQRMTLLARRACAMLAERGRHES
ncbi:MAG: paraquat-inducible protein A [Kiloniellales bacterium]